MTSAADLYGLQEIDLSRDTRRALIADIDSRLGETEDLVASRESVDEAQAKLDELRRRQRNLEDQLDDLDARIRPLETRLYGGTVRNPKELTDLQKDVEGLRRRRSGLDDEGLGYIESVEAAETGLGEAKSRLTQVEAAWRSDQEELRESRQRIEGLLSL